MKLTVFLCLLTAIVGCKTTSETTGSELNIVHGQAAPEGAFQETVFLAFKSTELCTGVIVGHNTVLTAAHCVVSDIAADRVKLYFDNKVSKEDVKSGQVKGILNTSVVIPERFEKYSGKPLVMKKVLENGRKYDLAAVIFPDNSFDNDRIVKVATDRKIESNESIWLVGYGQTILPRTSYGYRSIGTKRWAVTKGARHGTELISFTARLASTGNTTLPGPAPADSGGPLFVKDSETGKKLLVGTVFGWPGKFKNTRSGLYTALYVNIQSKHSKEFLKKVIEHGGNIRK